VWTTAPQSAGKSTPAPEQNPPLEAAVILRAAKHPFVIPRGAKWVKASACEAQLRALLAR